MSEVPAAHPGSGELAAFDAGTLSPAARAEVERHVATCADCCRTIDGLPEDDFVARLRALAGAAAFPPELMDLPRYRVLECVGAGGMGVVYRATHRLMDRTVALKVIHRRLSNRPAFVDHFRREVRIAARLSHPNIVTAHDADGAGDLHFLVMEYVEGETLDRRVARDGPLPIALACDVVRQAALGLQHAHEQGMVHRDVKPANLVLTPAGAVKVLDFGLAQFAAAEPPTEAPAGSALLIGTPDYLAPEQARDPASAGARADVYGLGCTLYFLLTGQPPFPGGTVLQKLLAHQDRPPPPVTDLRPDTPPALAALVGQMLAKAPADRPPTAGSVAQELRRLAASERSPSTPPRRRTLRMLLFLAPLVFAVAALLYLGWRLTHPADPQPGSPSVEQTNPSPPVSLVVKPEQAAREKTEMRNRAVDWLRENVRAGRDSEPVTDTAAIIDRDLSVIDGFQVEVGPRLLKSDKPTLLVGRAGELHVFELTGGLARDFSVKERHIHVATYKASGDPRRARPRLLLSNAVVEGAEAVRPGGGIKGAVAYRVSERWPGESSLRLTCYLAKRRRSVLIPQFRLPESQEGTIPFSFPPLGDAKELLSGPLVLFVEVVTKEDGVVTVESNAAAAVVHVAPAAR